MKFKHDWKHPITGATGYALFLEWVQRADKRLDLAAETLGVSTRTAQRWVQKKRVPHSKAVALDQLMNGRVIEGGLWRGRGAMIRKEWQPYIKTKFKDYR